MNLPIERVQRLPLPPLLSERRLQNPIFQFLEQLRLARFEPGKNVRVEPAVLRPGFQELKMPGRMLVRSALHASRFPLSPPLGELGGQQFPEQGTDADT